MVGDTITGSTFSSHAVDPWCLIARKVAQSGFPALSCRLGPKGGRKSGHFTSCAGFVNLSQRCRKLLFAIVMMATTCSFSVSYEAALQDCHQFS